MPKTSRFKRFCSRMATLGRSFGALFYPANLKNAFINVTKNRREYICFYLAALAMCTGFWTVALCTESNLVEARTQVTEAYDYHIEVANLNNEQYANLDYYLDLAVARENKYLADYYWVNDGKPFVDGTYTAHLVLTDTFGLRAAYEEVHYDILNRVSQGRREIRFSPLYSFEADFGIPYNLQFWAVSLAWLALSALLLLVLFLIRLDHFRFIYGIYMTYGADFPRLIGAAGGEFTVITLMAWLPGGLIGLGIAAALYLPAGVGLHITARVVLTTLVGGLLAVLLAVWLPVRRMASQPPIRHLHAGDNTPLVSSPRRSFFLFGEGFPGKYELYTFWRMRKYYLRLVVSAVLFASFFVSGLYIADMVAEHNDLDPAEYLVAYRPDAYYESLSSPSDDEEEDEDEEGEDGDEVPGWSVEGEEALMVWDDLAYFVEEIEAIPGVSHSEWDTAIKGGARLSHLLLSPGQLYASGNYTVPSEERASEGYRWAMNNYSYTAIDALWIDNMLRNGLATFEGDPYAALENPRHVIISEDVYNKQTYDFAPGDQIIVAVCEENYVKELITDPRELLRRQIRDNKFRFETFTVAAVMRGAESEDTVTLGVTYADYLALTGTDPVRSQLTVYMETGTDLDTVRAAEDGIRRLITPLGDWHVVPTGGYFDARVRGLKNDGAVALTLAICLLIISPMVWYFSQLLFYRKRKNEFALLRALGAGDAAFARMHRMAGGLLSAAAFLSTVLLSLLCNYLIYFTVGTLLPMLHLTESVHYDFGLSLPALLACILVSVACGYLSCELPYRLFVRRDAASERIEL